MPACLRWTLGGALALLVVVVPWVHYRANYNRAKRLRVVTPERVYRSGQMTADGFEEAITRYRIRTVVNLQDEYPDPDVRLRPFSRQTVKETELCRRLGVRYVYLTPDLIPRRRVPAARPAAIEEFLDLMDEPAAYPVLLHCKAGLHRTGILVTVYRMEYEGWSKGRALEELKDNGFGRWDCTSANDYIQQYVLTYQPGLRRAVVRGED